MYVKSESRQIYKPQLSPHEPKRAVSHVANHEIVQCSLFLISLMSTNISVVVVVSILFQIKSVIRCCLVDRFRKKTTPSIFMKIFVRAEKNLVTEIQYRRVSEPLRGFSRAMGRICGLSPGESGHSSLLKQIVKNDIVTTCVTSFVLDPFRVSERTSENDTEG